MKTDEKERKNNEQWWNIEEKTMKHDEQESKQIKHDEQ